LVAFPNPARHKVSFALDAPQAGVVHLDIFNLNGEKIADISQTCQPGAANLVWNCTAVAPGVYFVRLRMEGNVLAKTKVAILGDIW